MKLLKEVEMALVKCTECGREISDKAPHCIHCGAPIPEDNTKCKAQEKLLERAAKAKGDRRAALLIEAADIDLTIPKSAFEHNDVIVTYIPGIRTV